MNPRRRALPPEGVAELESVMRRQLEGYRRLLKCIERNRQAVRTADMTAIEAQCRQEHEITNELAELEKARLHLVGQLTQCLQPDAAAPLTVSQIAKAVDDETGRRFVALAAELRAELEAVRRASSVVRSAAEALSRHMAGLMQTVQTALCRAQVYGRRGRIASGVQKQFCIDVTS